MGGSRAPAGPHSPSSGCKRWGLGLRVQGEGLPCWAVMCWTWRCWTLRCWTSCLLTWNTSRARGLQAVRQRNIPESLAAGEPEAQGLQAAGWHIVHKLKDCEFPGKATLSTLCGSAGCKRTRSARTASVGWPHIVHALVGSIVEAQGLRASGQGDIVHALVEVTCEGLLVRGARGARRAVRVESKGPRFAGAACGRRSRRCLA